MAKTTKEPVPKSGAGSRPKHALSDLEIANLDPGTPAKVFDSAKTPGLHIEVTATGSKLWRLKFRLNGAERKLPLGSYTQPGQPGHVSLAEARKLAAEARQKIKAGVDPVLERKQAKAEQAAQRTAKAERKATFAVAGAMFIEYKRSLAGNEKITDNTLNIYEGRLKNHVYPRIGSVVVEDLTLAQVADMVDDIKAYSPVTAIQVLGLVKRVLDYAERKGLVKGNVAANRSDLRPKHKPTPRPALDNHAEIGEFLRILDTQSAADGPVGVALRLLVMLPTRPIEMCRMRIEQLDFAKAQWTFTVGKTGEIHDVPLPRQAVAILQKHLAGREGQTGWVFPSPISKGRHINRDSLRRRLVEDRPGHKGLGFERGKISAHGLRSMFRSIGHQELGIDPVILEICLSHLQPHTGGLGKAYARAQHMKGRIAAMQAWADFLDRLKASR